MAAVSPGVGDFDGVRSRYRVAWCLVPSAEVLDGVLHVRDADQLAIAVPEREVVEPERLVGVVRADHPHEVSVAVPWNLCGPGEPPALEADVVYVAIGGLGGVEQLRGRPVVVDPVRSVPVLWLPVGAGHREVKGYRCNALGAVRNPPEHSVGVGDHVVLAVRVAEQARVVGDAEHPSVAEAVPCVVPLVLVDGRVEAYARAVVVVVGQSVAVGVHTGAPVGDVHVVAVQPSVAVCVVVLVVSGAVTIGVGPLCAVVGPPVVSVVDTVTVVVVVRYVADSVAVEVVHVVGRERVGSAVVDLVGVAVAVVVVVVVVRVAQAVDVVVVRPHRVVQRVAGAAVE